MSSKLNHHVSSQKVKLCYLYPKDMLSIYDSSAGPIQELISNENALIYPGERDKGGVGKILLHTFF